MLRPGQIVRFRPCDDSRFFNDDGVLWSSNVSSDREFSIIIRDIYDRVFLVIDNIEFYEKIESTQLSHIYVDSVRFFDTVSGNTFSEIIQHNDHKRLGPTSGFRFEVEIIV